MWLDIETEAYAIHNALQITKIYLHSKTFTIYTDQRPLDHLLNSPMQNNKIQTWPLNMTGYYFSIEYLRGKENLCADDMSFERHASGDNVDLPIDVGIT